MSQLVAWFLGMFQQAIAILIGGVIAVGWGRQITERLNVWWEDRVRCIAYIDVPDESGYEAYYYIGSLPLPERPTVRDGNYRAYQEVSAPYTRWQFTPERPIRSRWKLYLSFMTVLRTQGDIPGLQGHPLYPSKNSWQPGKPLGRFEPLKAAKSK